jgi:molecular chaperone GrpE
MSEETQHEKTQEPPRPEASSAPEGAPPAATASAGEEPSAEMRPAAETAELSRRLDEVTRAYAQLVNDRESFKRRLERERDRLLDAQKGEIAAVLLDTMDELYLAIQRSGGEAERLAEGIRLIADNAGKRVEALGLTRIPAEGRLFDPSLHEAIDLVATVDAAQDGRVVEEVRAGWRLGERVIRASRVRVGKLVPAPAAGGNGAGEPTSGSSSGE